MGVGDKEDREVEVRQRGLRSVGRERQKEGLSQRKKEKQKRTMVRWRGKVGARKKNKVGKIRE